MAPAKVRLRVDIYLQGKDEAVEVKTGNSRIKGYQVDRYQRKNFEGGFSFMFVQNPFTGDIGPNLRDYSLLATKHIPFTQVWFTNLWPTPEGKAARPSSRRTNSRELHGYFAYSALKRRGLGQMVPLLLNHSAMNGVEIMSGVESLTHGQWRPTAGSLYPLLLTLVGEGLIQRRLPDGKFMLTPEAQKVIDTSFDIGTDPKEALVEMLDQLQAHVSHLEGVKSAQESELEPHKGRLRDLAKRLSDLAGEDSKN